MQKWLLSLLILNFSLPCSAQEAIPPSHEELSVDCRTWIKRDAAGKDLSKYKYLKQKEGVSYINNELKLFVSFLDNEFYYGTKEKDVGVFSTSTGLVFKRTQGIEMMQNPAGLMLVMTEVVNGLWATNSDGTALRFFNEAAKKKYFGLLCDKKTKCQLMDFDKKKKPINSDALIFEAQESFPILEFEALADKTCNLVQSERLNQELQHFFKSCRLKAPRSFAPKDMKKLCSNMRETIKPLLKTKTRPL